MNTDGRPSKWSRDAWQSQLYCGTDGFNVRGHGRAGTLQLVYAPDLGVSGLRSLASVKDHDLLS